MEVIDLDTFNHPHWQDHSACKNQNYDPDWWLNPKGGGRPKGGGSSKTAKAKIICNTQCPVQAKCLAWILDIESTSKLSSGIYGGKTASERMELRQCMLKGCNEEVRKNDPTSGGRYCSEEHRKEGLKQYKEKNENLDSPVEYYKKGIWHG